MATNVTLTRASRDVDWALNIDRAGSLLLKTGSRYLDKDISLTVPSAGALTVTGGDVNAITELSGNENAIFSTTNTSGVKVSATVNAFRETDLKYSIASAGWMTAKNNALLLAAEDSEVETKTEKYLVKVSIPHEKTFQLADGIYTWTWTVDSNGNVVIT